MASLAMRLLLYLLPWISVFFQVRSSYHSLAFPNSKTSSHINLQTQHTDQFDHDDGKSPHYLRLLPPTLFLPPPRLLVRCPSVKKILLSVQSTWISNLSYLTPLLPVYHVPRHFIPSPESSLRYSYMTSIRLFHWLPLRACCIGYIVARYGFFTKPSS